VNMSKERFFTLIRIFTVIELLLLLSSCGWSFPETQREPDYNYSQRQDGDPEPVELKQESNVGHGSVSRIIKKVSPSVVGISTAHLKRDSLWDDTRLVEGIGSGVIVHSTGYILTNDHVVGGNPDNISVILQNGDKLGSTVNLPGSGHGSIRRLGPRNGGCSVFKCTVDKGILPCCVRIYTG
jgi:S1-C subfamily serine protease